MNATEASVYIRWQEPTSNGGCSITGYEIYRTDLAGTSYEKVHASEVDGNPSLNAFNITELPSGISGSTMRIIVRAVNQASLTGQTDYVEVTVAGVPDAPSVPTEDSTTTTNTTIGVTYSAPNANGAQISSYEVQVDDGAGGDFSTILGGDSTVYLGTSAQTSTNIVQGHTYRVRVRARNVNGWSDYSDIAYILAASKPDPPPKPTYITSTETSITLNISFSENDNGALISGHKLFIDAGSLTSNFSEVTTYDGTNEYEVPGLTNGTSYRFYMVATNSKGDSEPSEESRFTASTPIASLRALSETSSTNDSITLSWSAPTGFESDITGYSVEMNDGSDQTLGSRRRRRLSSNSVTGTWTEVYDGQGNADVTSVTVNNLKPGVLHYFRYVAYDQNGPTIYSDVQSYYACGLPSAPGTPIVSEITLESMVVSWQPPEDDGACGITEYKLYRNGGDGGSTYTEVHSSLLANTPALTLVNVTEFPSNPNGKSFKFKVAVFSKEAINGVESAESSEYLMALAPAAPTDIPTKGNSTNATQIEVSFTGSVTDNGASIKSYYLNVVCVTCKEGEGFSDISGLSSDDLSLSRTISSGIVTGELYGARYGAINEVGQGPLTANSGYIEASQAPDKPNAPIITQSGTNIIISWTLPNSQGNEIKSVLVYVLNSADQFEQDNTTQVGESITVAMTDIISGYELSQNNLIKSYIVVSNDNGPSEDSDNSTSTILVQVAPLQPPVVPFASYTPSETETDTTKSTLTINVTELTGDNTGGSDITSYIVEYYSLTLSSWQVLGGDSPDSLVTSYTITGLVNGQTYSARYKARNIHGTGPYSLNGTVLVAVRPGQIDTANVTASGVQAVIEWNQPADNGGTIITDYNVTVKNSNNEFVQITDCVFVDPATTTCTVDMTRIAVLTGLPEGSAITIQVTAINQRGTSDPSTENSSGAVLVGDIAPAQTENVTTQVSDTNIVISWDAPAINLAQITYYDIQIKIDDSTNYSNENTYCNGSSETIVNNTQCTIPMTVLRASPFNLDLRDSVTAKVAAGSIYGLGDFSTDGNGATIQTEPIAISTIERNNASTTESQLAITWTALSPPDDGDSSVLLYEVQYRFSVESYVDGTNTYNTTSASFVTTATISANTSYTIRVRAYNIHGFGSYSSDFETISSGLPSQMSTPTVEYVAITSITGGISITWLEPNANSGTLDQYEITIADINGTYRIPSTCDGSNSTVFSDRTCNVTTSELKGSTYELVFRSTISVVIRAHNENGWGPSSTANTTRTVLQVPQPVTGVGNGTTTNSTQIDVLWSALTTADDTGDTSILSYNLQRETSVNVYESEIGENEDYTSTSYVVTTNIVQGTTYNFKVRARNIEGWGDLSSAAPILAAQEPPQMGSVTTAISDKSVNITWSLDDDNGSPITSYTLLFYDNQNAPSTEST